MISIGIIGAGRLGGSLAAALHNSGLEVKFISSLNPDKARAVSKITGATVIFEPYKELEGADIVFITTPDKAIAVTARDLARTVKSWKRKYVIHCSGILASAELGVLKERGAMTLSFHPLQTFPEEIDPGRFKDIYITVEGDDIGFGIGLAGKLGAIGKEIKAEMKPLYHAAACLVSGHLCGLIQAGTDCLQKAGIEGEGLEMLLPLIKGTIESIEKYGIKDALTGPIARGDIGTVKKHVEVLQAAPEIGEIYRALSLSLIELSSLDEDTKRRLIYLFDRGIYWRDKL